jgi:hypothetical protein
VNIDYVYDALAALRSYLPLLDDALQPGTPRRWSQTDLTEEQRERLDEQARAEREAKMVNLARGIKALGDGKAPLRLDVLDSIGDVHAGVTALEVAVCERLQIVAVLRGDTGARIAHIVGHLERIAGWPDLADHVTAEAVRLRRLAGRCVGDNEPVHRIDGRCPICNARSLRAFPDREVVACINASCRCDDEEECPCWWDPPRRHRWAIEVWPALAAHLEEVQ